MSLQFQDPLVYRLCLSRTNVDIDDEACATVMRRYRLTSKRDAINFALRTLTAALSGDAFARRAIGKLVAEGVVQAEGLEQPTPEQLQRADDGPAYGAIRDNMM